MEIEREIKNKNKKERRNKLSSFTNIDTILEIFTYIASFSTKFPQHPPTNVYAFHLTNKHKESRKKWYNKRYSRTMEKVIPSSRENHPPFYFENHPPYLFNLSICWWFGTSVIDCRVWGCLWLAATLTVWSTTWPLFDTLFQKPVHDTRCQCKNHLLIYLVRQTIM